ncbi:UNVERIFIED_CONTAM: hypothetical protein C3P02_20190, partial [Clostridioides difficile]
MKVVAPLIFQTNLNMSRTWPQLFFGWHLVGGWWVLLVWRMFLVGWILLVGWPLVIRPLVIRLLVELGFFVRVGVGGGSGRKPFVGQRNHFLVGVRGVFQGLSCGKKHNCEKKQKKVFEKHFSF